MQLSKQTVQPKTVMKEAACFQGQAVGLATASSLVPAGQRLTLTAPQLDLSKLTGHPAVSSDARAEPATGAKLQIEPHKTRQYTQGYTSTRIDTLL